MGRRAGSLARFTCCKCGATELVRGGTTLFRCSACRPAPTLQEVAHSAVAKAIRSGDLKPARGQNCADCGIPAIEYDHRDYTKPLAVDPVCRRCNLRRGPAIGSLARGAQRISEAA